MKINLKSLLSITILLLNLSVSAQQNDAESSVGNKIYHLGESESNVAILNDTTIPSSLMPCENCHGSTAEGKNESGISAPDIRWQRLLRDSRSTIRRGVEQGEKRPNYNRQLFKRLLSMGINSSDQQVSSIMPRYQLNDVEIDELISYLQIIDEQSEQGLSKNSINIGVLLPVEATSQSRVALQTIQAYFQQVNEKGGIFQRQLNAIVVTNLNFENSRQCCFAYLNLNTAQQQSIDYLQVVEQRPLLSLFESQSAASDSKTEKQNSVVTGFSLYSNELTHQQLLKKFAKESGYALINNPANENIPQQHTQLVDVKSPSNKAKQAIVLFQNSLSKTLTWYQQYSPKLAQPVLLIIGNINAADREQLIRYSGMAYNLLTPTPQLISAQGFFEYQQLSQFQQLPKEQLSSQLWSLALCKVLTHTLEISGVSVSKQKIVFALNSLYQFATEFGPELTFVGDQKIGAPGGLLVKLKTAINKDDMLEQWIE